MPDTPEHAAEKVLAALRAGDGAALAKAAATDDPDPWLVADDLCARGEFDAAGAFARAAPRKATERLPEYVTAQQAKPTDPKLREAVRRMGAALAREDAAGAMTLVAEGGETVPGVRLLYGKGIAHRMANRWAQASTAFAEAAERARGLGWVTREAMALLEAGGCAYYGGLDREALAAWEKELRIHEARGNRPGIAATLGNLGAVHRRLGDHRRALECQERTLKLMEELGDQAGIARTLGNLGNIHESLGGHRRALEYRKRSLGLMEELGDRPAIAEMLGKVGVSYWNLGDYRRAAEYQGRTLELEEELGDQAGVARALGNLGNAHQRLGDHPRALECQERSLELMEELGDRAGIASVLGNLGAAHLRLGDHRRALECQERSLKLKEELGDPSAIAATLCNIGNIHENLGDYPRALECQERSLRLREGLADRAGIAETLANLGVTYWRLGDDRRALECEERSLKLMEELGDRAGIAATLGNLGGIHRDLGDDRRALEYQERALKLMEELEDRAGIAAALGNIGNVHMRLGDYGRALEYQEKSLRLTEQHGGHAEMALTLASMGAIHERLGDYPRALEYHERALAAAREIGDAGAEMSNLWGIAAVHLAAGDAAKAAAFAREAVKRLPALVRRLGEEEGATAREQFARVFAVGARAGARLRDPSEVAFFLESGRAGGLLEALGGRDALRGTAVPEELRLAEATARAAESWAGALLGMAVDGGDRKEIATRRSELDSARDCLMDVIARIQRETKRAADVLYPKARPFEEIRGGLREAEALVLYGLFDKEPLALVVTSKEGRIVALEDAAAIIAAAEALKADDPAAEPAERAKLLADMVIRPLALDAKTTRVYVSPDGVLAYVPFALLLPGREVVYVPSGTTGLLLAEDRDRKGAGVLALGDPDYGAKRDERTLTVFRSGERLVPLPASGEEAKAVGDVVLLGGDATEAKLRAALATRSRWRAVHLACHGLMDGSRPLVSSLALTPGGEDDGFLQMLEVFRMDVPADLVVLSACETARGRVFRAEGVVGFTRAFMFAGAPRVIVSLWDVDDEATKALMGRFYELWNTMPAAKALLESQRFVASQGKWRHPRFWAAWQLWGLAE